MIKVSSKMILKNKLIAMFDNRVLDVECPIDEHTNKHTAFFKDEIATPEAAMSYEYPLDKLRYHDSWDWLIPVIKQAMDMYTDDMYFNKESGPLYTMLESAIRDLNIKEMHKALVEYIVWHNTNII